MGTKPEKKIEGDVLYDVRSRKFDVTLKLENVNPWLREVCITYHVLSDSEVKLSMNFGQNCDQHKIQVSN